MKYTLLAAILMCAACASPQYNQSRCSYYGKQFHNRKMANGNRFDMFDPSLVAHKKLPFGTRIEFCSTTTCAVAGVSDRGPYIKGREFDLSEALAEKLNIKKEGVALIKWRILS